MNRTPLVDLNVRDASNGQRIQLDDGSTGTVVDHWFCHMNVDAGVYRKVVWIDVSTLAEDDMPRLNPHVTNTITESWYRTHVTIAHCRENVEHYEV